MARRILYGNLENNFTIELNYGNQTQDSNEGIPYNISQFYVNATTHLWKFNKTGRGNVSDYVTLSYLENKTVVVEVPQEFEFRLKDEKTLGDFNMSSPTSIKLLQFCPNSTIETTLTIVNQSIPLGCEFRKIKFILEYSSTSYFRTIIFELNGSNVTHQDVYLIDLATTDYVYNTFQLDDLFSEYNNPSLWIKKVALGGTI